MIKILIADDEPLVRAGIKAVIPWNDHGFDVIGEVSDGNEAYEKILALKPDILITDIKMPGMDGITLLKKLKQEKVSIQSVVLSCFDEFELVREAMKYGARDYILKLSIDPAKILEVLGEIRQDLADLPENEPHFSLNTDDLKYLFIKKLQNRGFTSDEQIDNLLNQLCQRYPGNELFSLDEKGYLIIQNAEKNDFLCRQISAAMKQYANQTVYFGISPRLKDYSVFKDGLKQADDTLNTCVFYEKTEPLTFQMLTSAGFPFITSCLAQKLYISLSSGNTEKSCELISRFLLWLKSGLFFSSLCYSYLEEILNIYVRVAREQNFSIYQMQDGEADIFSRIRQTHTLRSCEQVLSGFTRKFTEFIREKRSGERSEILKIKEYLQLHYSENIDLNLIAELVNITPSHLSNLFKKETGVNFSTYLTDVRMKAARKLLQSPEFLIYEVAEKTGYSNAGYFGKAFKKYWGISPEEFKKEQR